VRADPTGAGGQHLGHPAALQREPLSHRAPPDGRPNAVRARPPAGRRVQFPS
jgi:hypothetical protein